MSKIGVREKKGLIQSQLEVQVPIYRIRLKDKPKNVPA